MKAKREKKMPGLWEKCEIRCVPEPDEVGKTSQSEDVFHYPPQELYFYAQKKRKTENMRKSLTKHVP